MLSSRPTHNELIDWEKNEDGDVRIIVTRQASWKVKLLSKFFYIPKKRRITLDELGSEVWVLCNGNTTVGQMIEVLSQRHQLNTKEAEVSLLSYLKTLGQKRFIGFALDKGQAPRRRGKASASGKKWAQ